MVSILYTCLLLLLVVVVEGQAPIKCGTNEKYEGCGSACTETCDYKPEMCIMVCKSGCTCEKGYVRQTNKPGSPCIKREACEIKKDTSLCGVNEIFTGCGSACVETCDHKPEICTMQCVPGCFCKNSDYVRQDKSTGSPCIRRGRCPK